MRALCGELRYPSDGFTEPDPRDDLNGLDVARKVVIAARESGVDLSLDDVSVRSLVPKELEVRKPVASSGWSGLNLIISIIIIIAIVIAIVIVCIYWRGGMGLCSGRDVLWEGKKNVSGKGVGHGQRGGKEGVQPRCRVIADSAKI